ILLANVLQRILHQVLLITRIKIYRHCSTINFTEDYFRQQYQQTCQSIGLDSTFQGRGMPQA
ncbi:MAG: hypothetical protein QNJ65_20655, partial [Xenococcaceae cyanobacterium MO_234.B1]|nr:hypothetical protein [Xenococcaceae cyanobacterium MO_234.B1]